MFKADDPTMKVYKKDVTVYFINYRNHRHYHRLIFEIWNKYIIYCD